VISVVQLHQINFEEAGCCVCGKLALYTDLVQLDKLHLNMDILISKDSGLLEWNEKSSTDPIC